MNTILTDDERPKLPGRRLDAKRHEEQYTVLEMEAYADAREAAVLAKLREQEPVAWQRRMRPTWGNGDAMWCPWEDCTEGQFKDCQRVPNLHDWEYQSRALYAAPLPAVVQVPQGWKLVPVEPTDEMRSALRGPGPRLLPAYVGAHEKADAREKERYAAMLAAAPEAPAQGDPMEKLTRIQEELGLYDDQPAQADMGNPISVPDPWREAVKVAREALQAVLEDTGIAEDDWNRAAFGKGYAALAQLDALEGGE